MEFAPMRILGPGIARPAFWFGHRAVAGGLLLALASGAVATAAGPAVAAPLSAMAPVQRIQSQGTGGSVPGKVTWGIEPATGTGPDGSRTLFDYGQARPGSTFIDHVEVANDSRQSAAFSIYGTDATGTTATGALLLLSPEKKPTDIGSWVHFPGGAGLLSTIIPGGKAVILTFSVNVPLQATPGDHTGGMVAAVSTTSRNSNGMSVTSNYRIAVPMELRVPGALRASLQVQSISTGFSDSLNPFGTGSATVSYSIANTGNVRLSSGQAVTVTGPFGQRVTIKQPQVPDLLPGTFIRYTAVGPNLFPAGPMTARVDAIPGWAVHTQPLQTNLAEVSDSASLFAMPWSLLGLFLLLIAAGVGVWWFLRWRRREHRAEVVAAAAKARRDTERRLLGTPAAGRAAQSPAAPTPAPSSAPDPDSGSAAE
jgi:hypothetical protein